MQGVVSGSAADRDGRLQQNDRIVEIEGNSVERASRDFAAQIIQARI